MIDVKIPYRLRNVANKDEYRFVRSKRVSKERDMLKAILRPSILNMKLPVAITLIRIAPRKLDDFENARMAFKSFKDIISSLFLPDYAPGQADELACFKWTMAQIRGEPKEYAVRIMIEELGWKR